MSQKNMQLLPSRMDTYCVLACSLVFTVFLMWLKSVKAARDVPFSYPAAEVRLESTATTCSEMSSVALNEMQPSIHATGALVVLVTSVVVLVGSPVVSVDLSGD